VEKTSNTTKRSRWRNCIFRDSRSI